jgi:hypothetical protein
MNRLARAVLLVFAAGLLLCCLLAAALFPSRLELVHVTLYNACTIRAYQVHWQNRERQPEPLRYDFSGSPVSVVFVALWFTDGPAWNLSRTLPLPCA